MWVCVCLFTFIWNHWIGTLSLEIEIRPWNNSISRSRSQAAHKKSMLIFYLIKEAHLHIGMCGFCVWHGVIVCARDTNGYRIDRSISDMCLICKTVIASTRCQRCSIVIDMLDAFCYAWIIIRNKRNENQFFSHVFFSSFIRIFQVCVCNIQFIIIFFLLLFA